MATAPSIPALALLLLVSVPASALAQSSASDVFSDVSTTSLLGLHALDEDSPAPKSGAGESSESTSEKKNAFDVWEVEHRWFRLGLRAYAGIPSIQETAALKAGAALQVPLTTDFFMGLGMKVAFEAGYNRGGHYTDDAKNCVNRGGAGDDLTCPEGQVGGVDYIWKEPIDQPGSACDGVRNANDTQAGTTFGLKTRRLTHVAHYSFTIGANYELTIPTVPFFRVVQPFIGGGVMVQWIYNYSDIEANECYLIDNDENDPFDPDNVDPWSQQGPEVGGEIYGGFHVNLGKIFRFAFELGYQNVTVREARVGKATAEFKMKHLEYRLANLRLGGGIEFRF